MHLRCVAYGLKPEIEHLRLMGGVDQCLPSAGSCKPPTGPNKFLFQRKAKPV